MGKAAELSSGLAADLLPGVVAAAKARGQTRELDPVLVEVLRDGSAKNRLSIHAPVFLRQQFSDAVHDEVGVLAQFLAPYPAAFG